MKFYFLLYQLNNTESRFPVITVHRNVMETHIDDVITLTWRSYYKVKEVHWQSVLSNFYTHYLSYICGNYCLEKKHIQPMQIGMVMW